MPSKDKNISNVTILLFNSPYVISVVRISDQTKHALEQEEQVETTFMDETIYQDMTDFWNSL